MRRYLFIALPICGILIADCISSSTDVALTSSPMPGVTAGPTCIPGDSSPAGVGTPRTSVLDVGQGDSIRIQSPGDKTMLVDAGDRDAGDTVVSALRSRAITSLDAGPPSHAHTDHIDG